MSDCKPAEMPWLTPYLIVKDAGEALTFYQNTFGFEVMGEPMQQDGKIVHAEMRYQESVIMFGSEASWEGESRSPATSGVESPVNLYVYVQDVDQFCANAKANGADVIAEPEDFFWGDRMCRIKDPSGHSWSFATKVGEFDPSKIPA